MMKRQISEEQLDNLMRTLVSDASADEASINQIADSPAMWWGVQRQINADNKSARSPWPPVQKYWRLLLVGVPVAAVLVMSFFVLLPAEKVDDRANNVVPPQSTPVAIAPLVEAKNDDTLMAVNSTANGGETDIRADIVKAKYVTPTKKRVVATAAAVKNVEIKTEFIALSYGGNPESGQIVRVKVPSSMMVTVGLVPSVIKPTSMIDAEVVVGDDGMTHAIRFIR